MPTPVTRLERNRYRGRRQRLRPFSCCLVEGLAWRFLSATIAAGALFLRVLPGRATAQALSPDIPAFSPAAAVLVMFEPATALARIAVRQWQFRSRIRKKSSPLHFPGCAAGTRSVTNGNRVEFRSRVRHACRRSGGPDRSGCISRRALPDEYQKRYQDGDGNDADSDVHGRSSALHDDNCSVYAGNSHPKISHAGSRFAINRILEDLIDDYLQ